MAKKWLLVAILVIAFVFRFQDIMSVPPGLYPDEAINGNNALQALETAPPTGGYKVFYPDNNGREGLFINIQAQFLRFFEPEPWTLRVVSATFGFLTVLGLYLLARLIFNWQIASIASFYLAVSFWHVNFSRIGFRAIMLPFFMVWGFYFLWRGLRNLRLGNFALSGLFFGLGLHTYIPSRFIPLVILLTLGAYWWKIKKDFSHEQYSHMRNEFLRGVALLVVVGTLVFLPLLFHFWQNPDDFFGRGAQISVFDSPAPLTEFLKSLGKTLASFNFIGDYNWRHNFSGESLLYWLVGVFFVIGFLKSIGKIIRKWKDHGHPSTLQVLLLSWFFIMILPSALTWEGIPHALRSIGALPAVMLFAAEGTWWFFETLKRYFQAIDFHPGHAGLITGAVLFILLAAVGIAEYNKYFNQWAKQPEVYDAFSGDFVELGNQINQMPKEIPKYVLVNAGGVLVNDIPMPAQTIMFITETYTLEKQKEKNVFYILPGEEALITEPNAIILPMVK